MAMTLSFRGKYLLRGQITCVTGLHIGGSAAGIEIGGVDNPVIKDPLTEMPYIPGSALKGKLRSLYEWSVDLVSPHGEHQNKYVAYDCRELAQEREKLSDKAQETRWVNAFALARLYGPASADDKVREQAGPTRLSVRDSFPTGYIPFVNSGYKTITMGTSVAKWNEWLGEGIYTEVKTENSLDRVTSEAMPRPIERVPAGSEFDFEMILDVYREDDHELFRALFTAMRLLENSALGGSGSRGHGQIEFRNLNVAWRSLDFYRNGMGEQAVKLPGEKLETVVEEFDTITWPSKG
ncbi:type III-A CRISPR-associated RAMP protein Csm3 [Anaerolineae bacterium CFX7]|nr:type III-A CRISPR-associated RAMP protein Csm3 [Anaerolineae bacterium CFX7]